MREVYSHYPIKKLFLCNPVAITEISRTGEWNRARGAYSGFHLDLFPDCAAEVRSWKPDYAVIRIGSRYSWSCVRPTV